MAKQPPEQNDGEKPVNQILEVPDEEADDGADEDSVVEDTNADGVDEDNVVEDTNADGDNVVEDTNADGDNDGEDAPDIGQLERNLAADKRKEKEAESENSDTPTSKDIAPQGSHTKEGGQGKPSSIDQPKTIPTDMKELMQKKNLEQTNETVENKDKAESEKAEKAEKAKDEGEAR